ncbi:MAG: hypothetical protein ACI83W_000452 [Marinoscillum sp.]|jgi:hypothetical protein
MLEVQLKFYRILLDSGKVKNAAEAAKRLDHKNITKFKKHFEMKSGVNSKLTNCEGILDSLC